MIEDSRGQGPPADIGNFQMPCTILTFRYTFSGVTYVCTMRGGERGWVLVGVGTDAAIVINAGGTYLNSVGGGTHAIARGLYDITAAVIHYSYVWMMGAGPATCLKLATGHTHSIIENQYAHLAGAPTGTNVYMKLSDLRLEGRYSEYLGSGTSLVVRNLAGADMAIQLENIEIRNSNRGAVILENLVFRSRNLCCSVFDGTDASRPAGVWLDGVYDFFMVDTYLNGYGRELQLDGCNDGEIDHTYFAGSTDTGEECKLNGTKQCKITNTRLQDSLNGGFLLSGSSYNQIEHVFARNLGQAADNTYDVITVTNSVYNTFHDIIYYDIGVANTPRDLIRETGTSDYNIYDLLQGNAASGINGNALTQAGANNKVGTVIIGTVV